MPENGVEIRRRISIMPESPGLYLRLTVAENLELFAQPGVASALLQGPVILAQVIFTPLLCLWSIWVGIAISARSSDIRAAQQLSVLGNLPLVALSTLIAFDVIQPTLGLALVLGGALIVVDRLGWRVVSAMFDRERLITNTR